MASPITSVQQGPVYTGSTQSLDVALPPVLVLDLRGTRETIERDVLVNLPESLLVVMFPNGLIFGPGSRISSYSDYAGEDEDVAFVDLDPALLRYVLDFYDTAIQDRLAADASPAPALAPTWTSPFPDKTALIVLREELDYYPILPTDSASAKSGPQWSSALKRRCGDHLVHRRRVFDALRRSPSNASPADATPDASDVDPPLILEREGSNAAEQQLIDMLCLAGFSITDQWGHRAREPHRCSVVSIALVKLVSTGKPAQMAAVQKLLLFWRKPARKCWWDGVLAHVPVDPSSPDTSEVDAVRLWARRTWTLELALV